MAHSAEAVSDNPAEGAYRQFLPDLSIPRFTTMQAQNAHEYAVAFKESGNPPWLHALYLHWRTLLKEPFRGITTDGRFPESHFQQRGLTLLQPEMRQCHLLLYNNLS
jgi:hypothetical protein